MTKFEHYLIEKGFRRFCIEHCGKKEIENYTSSFLSSYNPIFYSLRKENKCVWWGISEWHKPPVMFLGWDKIELINNETIEKTKEDGYRILFSKWGEDRYDEVYNTLMSDGQWFMLDCLSDEIKINKI